MWNVFIVWFLQKKTIVKMPLKIFDKNNIVYKIISEESFILQ